MKDANQKATIESLTSEIEDLKAKRKAAYDEVKDFAGADFIKTESAMKQIKFYNNEISLLEKQIKRIEASKPKSQKYGATKIKG
jgi:prefoldin subunit 5